MTNEHFTHFTNKILSDPARIVSWCPTSDLVLIVSIDNTISLYRSKISQLTLIWNAVETVDSNIKVVTWKPNGKELVIGCESGILYKVVTINEPLLIKQCWPPKGISRGSIKCLYWSVYKRNEKEHDIKGFDINAFDPNSHLPPLSQIPPIEPKPIFPTRIKKVPFPEKPSETDEQPTLLLVGTDTGHIYVILDGIYQIGIINMNMPILNINAEMNMDSLQVLTQSKETREYGLFVVNTHILQEKKQEIFTLSKIQTQLNYLFSYTNYNMDVLKKHYDVYSRQNKRVIDNAMDVTIKNSGQTDNPMPEVELVMLLATGGFSLVTKTLLLEYLTPQSIKTWETTSINECKQLQQILCNYVLPSLERIMVQLSQLLGYGRWKERYCDFIDPSSVEKWIDCVQKLIGRVLELTDRLRRLLKMFGAFVKWLHIVSLKLSDIESEELQSLSSLCEEPDLVFEYLEEWFIKDKLAEYFIDSNGKSLSTQLSDLEKSCSFPLQKPSEALSKKMQITSTHIFKLDIISPKNPSRNDIASFTSNDAELQTTYYAFINQDKKVVILKSDFTKTNFQYVCLNTTEDNVSDMEFFDHQELCIVTYNKNDTILYTVQLDQLEYKDFTLKIESEDIKFGRSLVLNRMIQAKLGCNGLPKRRIFATVASNGILNIYSMDKLEE